MLRDLRLKIRNRHSRISSCGVDEFLGLSKQFFAFIGTNLILEAIIAELLARNPRSVEEATVTASDHQLYGETSEQAATLSYMKWKSFADQNNMHGFFHFGMGDRLRDGLEKFRDWYVEPLFDYLDETIDDANVILGLLSRYKSKVEWYRRQDVSHLYESNTQRGEDNLSQHMYEYLFDQGLAFHIEPATSSGRPDLVSLDSSNEPLIADVKIFDGSSRGASYIKKGLYQVHRYCADYDQTIGYMVIFNISNKQLRLELPSQPNGVPRFEYNHKTIFIVVIDIHTYEQSASKRGVSETVTITSSEMIREVENEQNNKNAEPVTKSKTEDQSGERDSLS